MNTYWQRGKLCVVVALSALSLFLLGCTSVPVQTPSTAPEPSPETTPTELPQITTPPTTQPTVAPEPDKAAPLPEATNDAKILGSDTCNTTAVFTASPLAIQSIDSIITLGNLNPPGHTFPTDHIYFYIVRQPGNDHPDRVTLYSPGTMTITRIEASQHVRAGFTDYSIILQPCPEITVVFGHVTSLETEVFGDTESFQDWRLENEYETGGETYRSWSKQYDIQVAEGQILGTAGGNPNQWALDLFTYDQRQTQQNVANPSRWNQSQYLHSVDPLSYYAQGPVIDQLLELVDRERDEGELPPYGSVPQDLPGTAQGCWFREGITETYPEDPHLALVRDNKRPGYGVISTGNSIPGLPSAAYRFLPSDSGVLNRDFRNITADGIIYGFRPDRFSGVIIIQMPDTETLWIEALNSASTDPRGWSFSTGKSIFRR
jgi:hypothetical protein